MTNQQRFLQAGGAFTLSRFIMEQVRSEQPLPRMLHKMRQPMVFIFQGKRVTSMIDGFDCRYPSALPCLGAHELREEFKKDIIY